MKIKLSNFLIFLIALISIFLISCNPNKGDTEKKLIGFTIFEKSTRIGLSQKINNLNEIDLNGFYANDKYSIINYSENSYFDVKVDNTKLPGDLITPGSICLFVSANYYQAQNSNFKLFLYDIYLLNDGTYLVEYRSDIELPQNIGSTKTFNITHEYSDDNSNYVFTYKLNISKIANPVNIVVREFSKKHLLIKEESITSEISKYTASENTEYIIVTETNKYINEENEEIIDDNYIFMTKNNEKNIVFKELNSDNKIINFNVNFELKNDE